MELCPCKPWPGISIGSVMVYIKAEPTVAAAPAAKARSVTAFMVKIGYEIGIIMDNENSGGLLCNRKPRCSW